MLGKLRGRVSWAELRVDRLRGLRFDSLLRAPRPSLIVTNRRRADGGSFGGNADQQLAVLREAHMCGAEMIDIEYGWGPRILDRFYAHVPPRHVILSHHTMHATPSGLIEKYERMKEDEAVVLKIAFIARDIADTGIVFRLLERAHSDRRKLIAIAMGDRGEVSRVLGGKFGSYLTYAASPDHPPTAPGQLSYECLTKVYRASGINPRTEVFGLIGNPVSRSRGIYYHNEQFHRRRKDAVYVNFLVDHLGRFMKVYSGIVRGASVTMPFKSAIRQYLDAVEENAAALDAVNTVIRTNNSYRGYNTDLPAVLGALRARTDVRGKQALVVGSGAMARTMVFALLQGGAFPVVTGRTAHRVEALAGQFGCPSLPFEDRTAINADIVLNATSVGMPGTEAVRLFPPSFFRRKMLVLDSVQSPQPTLLIATARRHGCGVITGEEIFRAQAALQSHYFLSAIR